jgi:hypothetical protein
LLAVCCANGYKVCDTSAARKGCMIGSCQVLARNHAATE